MSSKAAGSKALPLSFPTKRILGPLKSPPKNSWKSPIPRTILKAIAAVGPDQGRPVAVIGERGVGKSHMMAALYHAVNDSASTKCMAEILGKHSRRSKYWKDSASPGDVRDRRKPA